MDTVSALVGHLSRLDIAAVLWFVACWGGYAWFADTERGFGGSLPRRVREYRLAWMREMLGRENRMIDLSIILLLVRNISFFASGAVLIVGGVVAVLGSGEKGRAVVRNLPFAREAGPLVWDVNLLLLVLIFVYAFFKFTWSLRQFNYLAIVMGAAPPAQARPDPDFARRAAEIASRAGNHFNRGMRAYYFGLAALGWFVHPYVFILATAWVVLVVYRREFRSNMLELLGPVGTPVAAAALAAADGETDGGDSKGERS